MNFSIMQIVYFETPYKTQQGGPWFRVQFSKTGQTVSGATEEEAIERAKEMKFHNPVLERIHG